MARVVFVKFKMNRSKTGIAGVAVSPKVRHACRRIAEDKAKPYAVAIAPKKTGAYAGAFTVQDVTVHGIPKQYPMTRGGARLANTDPAATVIEVGSARELPGGGLALTPAHFVLRKTLQQLHVTSAYRRGSHRDVT